jgi:hypothetical protein
MVNVENISSIIEQGSYLVELYRNDPVLAAYDLLNVDLAAIQRVILRDMWFKSFTISVVSRGGGKTFLLGVNGTLHCLLYPGYRVGLIGPSFRQSKLIFAEIEKLYDRSSILREACEKRPVRGSDICYLKFKSSGSSSGGYIEALPLGVDGAKIRGSRFYLVEVDELAQVPSRILDLVIRPFGAAVLEPMEKVRYIERMERLINEGLAVEDDIIKQAANKMIMTSSGYFKFSHMWDRMKAYWKAIAENESDKYAIHQVPYQILPKGFLDEENIKEAKRTTSAIEFSMEYEGLMVSDSDGFFKASLLENCMVGSNFTVATHGEAGREYVLGVDPNQGGSALCGLLIIELGNPNKIVYVKGLKNKTIQEITISIQNLSNKFNLMGIFMDSQGGGHSVKDLLSDGYNNHVKIFDIEENTYNKEGRKILYLVNPTPNWISEANFEALSLFERRELLLPSIPVSGSNTEEVLYEDVKKLRSQLLSIVVTETARGIMHFDTPKKGRNKDLYSALILAVWGVRKLSKNIENENGILHPSGLIRYRNDGSKFMDIDSNPSNKYVNQHALLRKR